MNPDHIEYAEWDAAYALGALSAADRRAFEEHLGGCDECRRAVAELTPTVGLLSRLTPDDARRVADEAGPDPSLRAGIVRLDAQRRARRRRTWWIASAAAAVALVIAAIVTPFALSPGTPQPVAMSSVADVPLEASLALTPVGWGTRIELECDYPDVSVADAPAEGWIYLLAVVGPGGESSAVSSWRAGPGSSARLSAATALDLDDIDAIEIRSEKGAVLMTYSPGG